jgi:hypothetical protein
MKFFAKIVINRRMCDGACKVAFKVTICDFKTAPADMGIYGYFQRTYLTNRVVKVGIF